jgi:hypothetical protein
VKSDPETGTTILVPIGLHGMTPMVLKSLVNIAHNLNRNLLGLELKDERLQRAATLPFTTEIVLDSGRERGLLPTQLEARHSQVARDTRAGLLTLARQAQVKLVFEEVVGTRLPELLARYGQLDVFIPPRRRWQMVLQRARVAIPRVAALLTGGAVDDRVMQAAQALVDTGQVGELYPLTAGNLGAKAAELRPGRTRVLPCANIGRAADALERLLRQSPYDLLILPRDCLQQLPPAMAEQVLSTSPGQLLLVT